MNLNELKPAEGSKRQLVKGTMDKNKDQVHMYHLYLKVDKCQ